MYISLRVRLDSTTDRLVIEFEPAAGNAEGTETVQKIPVEGLPGPLELGLDPQGYITTLSIPGLKAGLAALRGEKPGKPAKPLR